MKPPPKNILYKGISIRPMSPKDGPAIFTAVNDSLPALRQYLYWAHYTVDFARACAIYAEFEAKTLQGDEANFCGFDTEKGDLLFCASLCPGSRLNPSALDLGYWIPTKYAGRGFGTLAAKLMTVLAFIYYKTDRLSVVCNPENLASLRIIEKTGFKFEGKLRNYLPAPNEKMITNGYSEICDAHCFSLLPKEAQTLSWFDEIQKDLILKTAISK